MGLFRFCSLKANRRPPYAGSWCSFVLGPEVVVLALLKRGLDQTRTDRWQSAIFLTAAAIALGNALHIANGFFHPDAITYLSWAFLFCALAVLTPRVNWLEAQRAWPSVLLLAAGLMFQFGELLTDPPGMYLRVEGKQTYATYIRWLAAGAVVAASLVLNGTWVQTLQNSGAPGDSLRPRALADSRFAQPRHRRLLLPARRHQRTVCRQKSVRDDVPGHLWIVNGLW